jgi:hypothetical protein
MIDGIYSDTTQWVRTTFNVCAVHDFVFSSISPCQGATTAKRAVPCEGEHLQRAAASVPVHEPMTFAIGTCREYSCEYSPMYVEWWSTPIKHDGSCMSHVSRVPTLLLAILVFESSRARDVC